MFPKMTIILGGASSGKSGFAEKLIGLSGLRPVYVASATAHDDEMRTKIARHRTARGADWALVEAPLAAAGALLGAKAGDAVLFDTKYVVYIGCCYSAQKISCSAFVHMTRDCAACVHQDMAQSAAKPFRCTARVLHHTLFAI